MKKLCIIYKFAPHYRKAIFYALDNEYNCDWYFGENKTGIKEMDLSLLKKTNIFKIYGNIQKLYWQGIMISVLFNKKYKNFLVLAETRSISFWLMVFLKRIFFSKKKLYGWGHGWYGRENIIHKRLDRLKFNMLDGLFLYNNYARNLMIDGGINPKKLFVIGNSLDYDNQLTIRKSLVSSDIYIKKFNNNNPVLIFIGRLTKEKKLDELIDAIAILKKKGRNFNIVFIGDGEEKTFLEQQAKNKGISYWFYGPCYDEHTNAELIYNADLCISPGNVGLTAIHSMMFGTPVITHNDFRFQGPEFESIISGETGDFFEKNNIQSLSEKINSWFENKKDRNSIREMCYNEIERQWTPKYQMKVIKDYLNLNE